MSGTIKAKCDNCKIIFEWKSNSYHFNISKHHFCDRNCYNEWRREIRNHPHWKGGKIKMLNYEFTKVKDHPYASITGYVKTARLVIEKNLGRYLDPEEVVHHIDGDVTNNDINNLMLFENKSEHTKYHWKLRKLKKKSKQLVLQNI